MAHDIGEKPGGWSVYLDDSDYRLPPCGSCGKGQNTKYDCC